MEGFRAHFREARVINRERKVFYANATNGKTKFVSNVLIWSEHLLYPVAWYFDIRARKYNRMGIPIVTNDFVSLQTIPSVEKKPLYTNILTKSDLKELSSLM